MTKEQDLDEILDAIIWAHRIVELDNGQTYIFRPLSLEERNMSNYVYEQAKITAQKQKMLTKDELTKQSIKQGLWKASNEGDAKLLREELSNVIKELEQEEKEKMLNADGTRKRKTPTSKYKKLGKRIEYIKEQLTKIEEDYARYIELPSIEYYAERERGTYCLSRCTLTFPEMEQVWPRYQDLLQETNRSLVAKLMNLYYSTRLAEESEIRKIARSGLWRVKWLGSKKSGGVKTLFGREMYNITMDQFRLVYWSQIYDSAFESIDAPSDEIVDNDELFDKWLEEQAEKRRQEKKESELNKRLTKDKKGKDGQEVGFNVNGYYCEKCTCGVKEMKNRRGHLHAPSCPYGVFIYYNHETKLKKVEEIQSANPEGVRKLLASEQKRLSEIGSDGIEEQRLRNDVKTRATLGMPTKVVGNDKNIGRGNVRYR